MSPLFIERKFVPRYQTPIVEQITEFLTDAIVKGQLKSGQPLIENELQRTFGISRAPIREAFHVLEKNGLILKIPRKGAYVRKITRSDIEENFPIRAYLESLAARLAIPHLTPKDIERMESALLKMKEAAKKKDFRSYLKYHSVYHEIFIYASKNKTLIEILDNLRRQALWFRFSYLYIKESYKYAIRIHRKILDLFIKKDADQLEGLVKEHILIALDRFLQFLASIEKR